MPALTFYLSSAESRSPSGKSLHNRDESLSDNAQEAKKDGSAWSFAERRSIPSMIGGRVARFQSSSLTDTHEPTSNASRRAVSYANRLAWFAWHDLARGS